MDDISGTAEVEVLSFWLIGGEVIPYLMAEYILWLESCQRVWERVPGLVVGTAQWILRSLSSRQGGKLLSSRLSQGAPPEVYSARRGLTSAMRLWYSSGQSCYCWMQCFPGAE